MLSFLVILAVVGGLIGSRVAKHVPKFRRVFSWGDDLAGWNSVFEERVPQRLGRQAWRLARGVLWFVLVLWALSSKTGMLLLVAYGGWRWWRRGAERRGALEEQRKSGMTAEELRTINEAAIATLSAMGLASKGTDVPVPPRLFRWRKRPVTVGGKAIPGEYVYSVLFRPAPGRSVNELEAMVGRGLDASDDRLRDAMNSTLSVARGRPVTALRKAGLWPQPFVLTTLSHVTRRGEKIGVGQLSFWSTDPFRRPVAYPYDVTKPVITSVTQPAPIGLYRGNVEATKKLNTHQAIMGSNGSGKSSEVRPQLVAAAHLPDVVIVMVALKGPRDYIDLQPRFAGGVIVTDPRIAAQLAVWTLDEVNRRNAMPIAELDKEPDLLIYVDEGHVQGDDQDLWIQPAKMGRSARVWIKWITQYAPSSVKKSEGGMSTVLLRELKDRDSGRIEGNYSHAQVAVGQRVTKSAGPHMIPGGDEWNGVLFDNTGQYTRIYWLTHDSYPGRPSDMARLAAACPTRPADPPGFADALVLADDRPIVTVTDTAPAWPADGAVRAADGSATRLEFEEADPAVQAALQLVWPKAGKRTPPCGRLTAAEINKLVKGARARVTNRADNGKALDDDAALLEAADLVERFMSYPTTDAPAPV